VTNFFAKLKQWGQVAERVPDRVVRGEPRRYWGRLIFKSHRVNPTMRLHWDRDFNSCAHISVVQDNLGPQPRAEPSKFPSLSKIRRGVIAT